MRENLRTKLEESNRIMQSKQHKKAQEREFQVDDLVYVRRYVLGGANYKLSAKFDGPYKVIQKLSKHKYLVKHLLSGKERKYHVDRLKIFSSTESRELNKHEFLEETDSENEDESELEDSSDSDSDKDIQTDIENQPIARRDGRLRPLSRKNYEEGQFTFYRCVR